MVIPSPLPALALLFMLAGRVLSGIVCVAAYLVVMTFGLLLLAVITIVDLINCLGGR